MTRSKPRIFLVGYGPTTETALRSLAQRTSVVGILRDQDPSDAVNQMAVASGIPLIQPGAAADLGSFLEAAEPDCVVVSSYNRIIKADLLSRWTFINVHYAPLPRYRGRAPVNWAIINGESSAAITIHLIDEGLDSGNILYQEEIPIGEKDTVTDLYERLHGIQERHLADAVLRVVGGWRGTAQDHSQATYGCARTPEDGEIDWRASAMDIDRLIRALTPPFPGAFTHYRGERVIFWKGELVDDPTVYAGSVPGRILRFSKAEGWVDVLTGQGSLRVLEVETEDGVHRRPAEVFGSTRASLGLCTSDLLALVRSLSEASGKTE